MAIYTYNLTLFDPTWFGHESFYIKNKLMQQAALKDDPKLGEATEAYGAFLDRGGELRYEVLRPWLVRRELEEGRPVLADPLRGNPMGGEQIYETDIDRVLNAILLGIVTYDANLILITPPEGGTTD
ncbi:MAG: hypothetical protein U5K31_01145 [Balneolaceae bacterium]|nr:hypothetical protein [Balneolaceae bacterium]